MVPPLPCPRSRCCPSRWDSLGGAALRLHKDAAVRSACRHRAQPRRRAGRYRKVPNVVPTCRSTRRIRRRPTTAMGWTSPALELERPGRSSRIEGPTEYRSAGTASLADRDPEPFRCAGPAFAPAIEHQRRAAKQQSGHAADCPRKHVRCAGLSQGKACRRGCRQAADLDAQARPVCSPSVASGRRSAGGSSRHA